MNARPQLPNLSQALVGLAVCGHTGTDVGLSGWLAAIAPSQNTVALALEAKFHVWMTLIIAGMPAATQ